MRPSMRMATIRGSSSMIAATLMPRVRIEMESARGSSKP